MPVVSVEGVVRATLASVVLLVSGSVAGCGEASASPPVATAAATPVPTPTAAPTLFPTATADTSTCEIYWSYSGGQVMATVDFAGPGQATVVAHYPDLSSVSSTLDIPSSRDAATTTFDAPGKPSAVEAIVLSDHGDPDCSATKQSS
jgi:hypothetical protein